VGAGLKVGTVMNEVRYDETTEALKSERKKYHLYDRNKQKVLVPSTSGGDTIASSDVDPNFRLAWLHVEGWRQRLRKGGDIIERSRWEWRVEDISTWSRRSSMSSGILLRDARTAVASATRNQKKKKKSVHWA
jgi:ribonucleotide reductase alpha subunit